MGNEADIPDVRGVVDGIIGSAVGRRASDVHVEPVRGGYEVRVRVDGLLETVGKYDAGVGRGVVNRLMVMAHLLTYRMDIPQEGRASVLVEGREVELRVSVMPTVQGMRAAVRLPAELGMPSTLEELGLSGRVVEGLERFARAEAGMLVVSGPAGSGKTTTIYALLRHIAQAQPGVSIISLEDPVERAVAGVTQIEIAAHGELTFERALRSVLRQDPQVLMVGEVRDGATASIAVQAALSGHRLICTLHAASAAGAVARLVEMGVETYQVANSVFAVVTQRLLRRKQGAGYRGRVAVAEMVMMEGAVRKAVLAGGDIEAIAAAVGGQSGWVPLRAAAGELVGAGVTDEAEVGRVLGG